MGKHYLASLPERTLRAGAAAVGGMAYETTEVLLPRGVRRSKLYQATIARLLQLTIELIGDVHGVYPATAMPTGELLVRKTAGNAVELASFVALGWSPLWLLAVASDVSGGTRRYLEVLIEELKTAHVLPADADLNSVADLLTALEGGSGELADAVDVPPLALAELRASWQRLQQHATELPTAGELQALFDQVQAAARQEQRSLLEISSIVALGAARAGAQLGTRYVLDYYRDAFQAIAREGLGAYLRRISRPYRTRIRRHFDPQQPTYSERILTRWRRSNNE